MTLGPLMLDIRGYQLEEDEIEMLQHPLVGGVILFSRNYSEPAQLTELCRAIHSLQTPPLLIAVDHEGGRVQRFHQDFTTLPPCGCYGTEYDKNNESGLSIAEDGGWIMASELLAVGVDFSFAPVLDLNRGLSRVIGDRGFHEDVDIVSTLARQFMKGMKAAGMAAVGKHFPGHGSVIPDSHHETPVDSRAYEDIAMSDLVPFERLIQSGIPAIMPAHVIYDKVDQHPAGYSSLWMQKILRGELGFQGVIFSDDINMAGAGVAGEHTERAEAALGAGCDMVLICNNQAAAGTVLDQLQFEPHPASQARLMRMHGKFSVRTLDELKSEPAWQSVSARLGHIEYAPELALGDDEIRT